MIFFKPLIVVVLVMATASCAKLPLQSVNLMQQIKDEGQRMHKLNIAYVNLLFDSKTAAVDSFMKQEYIPEFISNIKKGIDANGIDMSEEWPEVFPKIVPVINAVRDSLRTALVINKQKIVSKLNEDYEFYRQACDAQIGLLSSATKLNNSSKQVFNTLAAKITGNKIDLAMLEQKLNGFLKEGDNIAQKILFINDAVQTITGNQ
jgi:hypothetical protein